MNILKKTLHEISCSTIAQQMGLEPVVPDNWTDNLPTDIIESNGVKFMFSSIEYVRYDFGFSNGVYCSGKRFNPSDDDDDFETACNNGQKFLIILNDNEGDNRAKQIFPLNAITGFYGEISKEYIKKALLDGICRKKESAVKKEQALARTLARKKYAIGDIEVVSERQDGDKTVIEFSEGISLDQFYDYIELVREEYGKDICDVLEAEDGKKWGYSHKI